MKSKSSHTHAHTWDPEIQRSRDPEIKEQVQSPAEVQNFGSDLCYIYTLKLRCGSAYIAVGTSQFNCGFDICARHIQRHSTFQVPASSPTIHQSAEGGYSRILHICSMITAQQIENSALYQITEASNGPRCPA